MSKQVLMVAFHYPPVRGSSGLQRSLKFSRYLPEDHGWLPTILSANPRAYLRTTEDQLGDIPSEIEVVRAFALDTARHLALFGRYPRLLALPDSWVSWFFGAVPAGLRLVRKTRPDVLWSTYPIATAHLIGLALHLLTRTPWVADFRDSMSEEHYPRNRTKRRVHRWIEGLTVRHASRVVFTTSGALSMYAERYPDLPPDRWVVIENGYDEEDFTRVQSAPQRGDGPTTLVHSGLLYRRERDPRAFFAALGKLRKQGRVGPEELRIVLRASGEEDHHRADLRRNGIEDIVFLAPPIPYRDALAEMLSADGLLVFQSSGCNHQIPAKIYEYLRAQRPILALTDPQGDTAGVLRRAGVGTIARLDSQEEIAQALLEFLRAVREGRESVADSATLTELSRRGRTGELARLLEEVAAGRAARTARHG
jgi:glycosyltransferase involved in cell wall biosynthesis